ncbi:hypothetical protein FVE85_4093 [Porphyridium purpureum]|uniref:Fe/B12 periplasmic-binding domain-containing protein n=1 Tax=Porphyridium purpureum TaxID=35688 RepID=A0A5J4YS44_PORPP|nr:hypothetical protein FVE85_4093 [Porphyridium purpureum]|eukprot:POR1196..scf229_5
MEDCVRGPRDGVGVRVASLLPAWTETVHSVARGECLVGVTHEDQVADASASALVVTRNKFDGSVMTSAEIAATHRASAGEWALGQQFASWDEWAVCRDLVQFQLCSFYHVSCDALIQARPTLILTHVLETEMGSLNDVERAVRLILSDSNVQVMSMDPTTLSEIYAATIAIGKSVHAERNAFALVARTRFMLEKRSPSRYSIQSAVIIQWLDPLYVAGGWLPDMLERLFPSCAGCTFTRPGGPSLATTWDQLATVQADLVIVAPCGMDLAQAEREFSALAPARIVGSSSRLILCFDATRMFSLPSCESVLRTAHSIMERVERLTCTNQPDAALASIS